MDPQAPWTLSSRRLGLSCALGSRLGAGALVGNGGEQEREEGCQRMEATAEPMWRAFQARQGTSEGQRALGRSTTEPALEKTEPVGK